MIVRLIDNYRILAFYYYYNNLVLSIWVTIDLFSNKMLKKLFKLTVGFSFNRIYV